MEEITIVRKRSRVVPIVLALLVLAIIVLAVLYMIGIGGVQNIGAAPGMDPWAPAGGIHHGVA